MERLTFEVIEVAILASVSVEHDEVGSDVLRAYSSRISAIYVLDCN